MAFIESYQQNLNKTKLLSKIASFLIAIILLTEVTTNIFEFTSWSKLENVSGNLFEFKLAHLFLIPIAIVFTIRFTLLWIKSKKFIWFNLFSWQIGWVLILAYYLTTQKFYFGSIFTQFDIHCADCIYSLLFLWASKSVAILLYSYLLFSPIKQVLILFVSLLNKKMSI